MKTNKPTQEEIKELKDKGEIVFEFESESGLGKYEAILVLPDTDTQDYILRNMSGDNVKNVIESTKESVVLWANNLTKKSLVGMTAAYGAFFSKITPSSLLEGNLG